MNCLAIGERHDAYITLQMLDVSQYRTRPSVWRSRRTGRAIALMISAGSIQRLSALAMTVNAKYLVRQNGGGGKRSGSAIAAFR